LTTFGIKNSSIVGSRGKGEDLKKQGKGVSPRRPRTRNEMPLVTGPEQSEVLGKDEGKRKRNSMEKERGGRGDVADG